MQTVACSRGRAFVSATVDRRPRLAGRRGQHAPRRWRLTPARSGIRLRRRRWGSLWLSYNPSPAAVVRYDVLTLQAQRRYPFASGSIQAPFQVAYGLGAAWVPRLRQRGASNRRSLRRDAGDTRRVDAGRSGGGLRLGLGGDVRRRHRVANRPVVRDRRVYRQRRSRAFGVAVGDGSVWVTNNCDGTVSRIDPASNEVVATIDTGTSHARLDVGHGYVWSA